MRLWHQDLISILPDAQIKGQHRECCALRGGGWGRKHSTVDYVFTHSPYMLYEYHLLIMREMRKRGWNVEKIWYNPLYRGQVCVPYTIEDLCYEIHGKPIYLEHNIKYLQECLDNLASKHIFLKYAV
jgi:uncharacterized protein (TIGR02328 family)